MLKNISNLKVSRLTLITISILAIVLFSFFGIGRSVWLDEANSIYIASHNFKGIIANLKNDSNPPLYYFSLAIWIRLFGISELAVRCLSGIFYILSLVAVYGLGKALYNDKETGLLCSFLYMLSPVAIRQAQNARMYSLLGLLGILSTLLFLRLFLIKTNSKKDLALYIVVNILGTFTHYWFFFIIFSQVFCHILLFFRSSIRKFSSAIFISIIPFLALWLPILLLQVNNGSSSWMSKPSIYRLVDTLLSFYGSGKLALLVYAGFLALIIFRIKDFKIRFKNISALKEFIIQKRNLAFLIILSVSLLTPLIISQVKPIYVSRYTIIALLPFVMLIGALLSKFGNKILVLVCCYILLAGVSIGFINRTINPITPQQYADKSTTEYLIKHADNNDILIFTSLSRAGIDYYLRLKKPNKTFIKISFPSEIASHLGWRDVNKMLSRRHILESEAKSIIGHIDTLIENNKKIWLIYGYDTEISEILKNRLDTHFSLKEEKDLPGLFYNKIFIYEK